MAAGAALIVLTAIAALWQYRRVRQGREAMFAALEPVTLADCEIARYGDAHDGGYLLCRNLMARARAAYSFGINGTDEWGCQVSRERSIPVHQYDCYNTTVPPCAGAAASFHAACVGPRTELVDGRPFGTMGAHIANNGDAGRPLLVKMDVEGSEWRSLRSAPDEVLRHIDQLVVEFHGVDRPEFVGTIERLKEVFHVANVHINNYSCDDALDPFPGSVFEVLFVNRQIAEVAPGERPTRHHPLDAPNGPRGADCQTLPPEMQSSEFTLFAKWVVRFARTTIFGSPFVY